MNPCKSCGAPKCAAFDPCQCCGKCRNCGWALAAHLNPAPIDPSKFSPVPQIIPTIYPFAPVEQFPTWPWYPGGTVDVTCGGGIDNGATIIGIFDTATFNTTGCATH